MSGRANWLKKANRMAWWNKRAAAFSRDRAVHEAAIRTGVDAVPDLLIDELSEQAVRSLEIEQKRETSLDSKAFVLVAATQVSLAMLVFGVTLTKDPLFAKLSASWFYAIAALFGFPYFASCAGLAVLRGDLITRSIGYEQLLDPMLVATLPSGTSEEQKQVTYKRGLVVKILQVASDLRAKNDWAEEGLRYGLLYEGGLFASIFCLAVWLLSANLGRP
jgi:hypothetical protein